MPKKMTVDEINQRLRHKNITLIGEYVHQKAITQFRCDFGHEWETSISNILYQSNCPHCTRRVALTVDIINERLKDRKITMICDNDDANKKSSFRCEECDTEWSSRLNSVLGGYGCIKCKKSGFSYEKSAHAYILVFEDFFKFGISNTVESRLHNHRRKLKGLSFEVRALKEFKTGAAAFEWEQNIKKKFGGSYVSRDKFVDGYTETLSLSLLDEVLETLKEDYVE